MLCRVVFLSPLAIAIKFKMQISQSLSSAIITHNLRASILLLMFSNESRFHGSS
jgi:hypothetical protein